MLPKPSLCLNIPKTGSSFTNYFFNAADWLELKRLYGLNHLTVPHRTSLEFVKTLKRRCARFGNLSCRAWHHHAGYSTLPAAIRHVPKLCALRDLRSWYCSFYLYYTHSMTNTLLSRAIRLLVDNDDRGERDEKTRALLFRHRRTFLDRFKSEDARADSIENVSMEFLVWFNQTIRIHVMMDEWVGLDSSPTHVGFLTFRTITLLFDDPRKVLSLEADAFADYFAGGHYLRDLRCDFFLDTGTLTDQLCAVMIDELGYTREIVTFLKERVGRKNTSPEAKRDRVMRELDRGDLFARIRTDEEVYEKYLLPLAGSRACHLRTSRR